MLYRAYFYAALSNRPNGIEASDKTRHCNAHGIVLIEASSMQTADPFLKATTMRLDGLTASLDLRMQLINVSLKDTNSYPTQWRTEHKFPQVR